MESLERWSGKSTNKLYNLLSYATKQLSKRISKDGLQFEEEKVLSQKKQKRIKTMNLMMSTANICIKGLKRRISKEKVVLLTGVAAMFLPSKSHRVHGVACDILGINRKASYVKKGMSNREEFDSFIQITGEFQQAVMQSTFSGIH